MNLLQDLSNDFVALKSTGHDEPMEVEMKQKPAQITREQLKLENAQKKNNKERQEQKQKNSIKHQQYQIRCEVAIKELKLELTTNLKDPEKHPRYQDEWKIFWVKRYKELVVEGKDPNSHNFNKDWIEYWPRKIVELYNDKVCEKREIIRKEMNITKKFIDKFNKNKDESDSSSDEEVGESSKSLQQQAGEIDEEMTITNLSELGQKLVGVKNEAGILWKILKELFEKADRKEKEKKNSSNELLDADSSAHLNTLKQKLDSGLRSNSYPQNRVKLIKNCSEALQKFLTQN
jgi:hypothetical protein